MCARSCRNRAVKLLRHLYYGPLSALTGGYIIRFKDGLYPNLTLSLIWFSFFFFPLSLYYLLFFLQPGSPGVSPVYWTLYVGAVGAFFTGLKITNFRLHRIFDREEQLKRKRRALLDKLKREKEARDKKSGGTQLGGEGDTGKRETIFSDNDTVPEIGPLPGDTGEIHLPSGDRLLPDPLGSLSENSSIRLKSTTPSLQNPGRQSPSIEMTIFSETIEPKQWEDAPPVPPSPPSEKEVSERPTQFGFDSQFSQGEMESPQEDKFMTPVNLPPPGAPQHSPDSKAETPGPRTRSPYPDPFAALAATESPYKMPPFTGEKISRSRSQQYLTDSGSQEEVSIHATRSVSEMPCASPPDSSKKSKENYEIGHFDTPDPIEKELDVHIREKPPGAEGGAEPSNSLLDFELTTPDEIEKAINMCHSLGTGVATAGSDLLQHMSEEEMVKFIEFATQNGGHVAFDQQDASPGATCFYRDLVDGVLVAYKFGTLPGQMLEERIMVDPSSGGRDIRTSYRVRESTSSGHSHSSMGWDPVQDSGSSPSPARRIEISEIEISGPPAARKRLGSSRAEVNRFYLLPKVYLPVRFTRTQLERYFDRDQSLLFVAYFVLLSVVVCATGIAVLRIGFYHHVFVVWFCVIMASCQFSLLRTIVPDPASSVHGYNKYLAMSKAFYFSFISVTALIVDALTRVQGSTEVVLYGFNLNDPSVLLFIRDALLISLLCLPAGAIWGLLPQVDTFLIYLTEKIDMDLFGGTAAVSLVAGIYSVARSVLTVALFSGLAILSYLYTTPTSDMAPSASFSFLFAVIFTLSYLLSRSVSDPYSLLDLIRNKCGVKSAEQRDDLEIQDPVPPLIRRSIRSRLVHDILISVLLFLATFGLSLVMIFSFNGHEIISLVLRTITILVGVLTHYIMPHLRKKHPWLLFRDPLLRSKEYSLNHEVRKDAKIMWFEKIQVWLGIIERYILYPVVFIDAMTNTLFPLLQTFGGVGAGVVLSIAGLKVVRHAFCDTDIQYIYLLFTYLFFTFDYPQHSNGFLFDYFVLSFLLSKIFELKYKLHFLFIYQAPWNMPWGGITHFIIQPLLIPHPGFIFLQAVLAALLSAPLNPFIASSLFLLSYVRPVKFWEKSYRTRHFDNTEGRLSNVLESRRGINAEHMDSIFYDHLAHSLQRVLAGEIQMGRWGLVRTGDFFIIIRDTDNITAFVHIIEVGNGFITFQLRGCELKGTYCHNMELRSMNEGFDVDDERCCCCKRCCRCSCPPYESKHLFCFNAYCDSRWSGWEIINTAFVLRGYSKIENDASYIFNTHDAFRIYNTLFVKAMVYYLIKSPLFFSWINNPGIKEGVEPLGHEGYSDPHPYFLDHCNVDFDKRLGAVTLAKFNEHFGDWLKYCLEKRNYTQQVEYTNVSVLGWGLSLAGRRVLGSATQQNIDTPFSSMWNISFLHGVYGLFKGDYRINCPKDEWLFEDIDLLRRVISPALKIALKLQQDQYLATDEGQDPRYLYQDILATERDIVIAHEGDPQWIRAVVSDRPSLFTLRYTPHENNKLYQFVRLNTRYLQMRLIKMNSEVIRGLWASQQQEQVYFQQDLSERASIQNLKCVARNLVNSSMDQPIGYPIYVSSLLTSYVDMNSTLNSVTGGLIHPVTIGKFLYRKIKGLARKGKSSSGAKEGSSEEPKSKPENREDTSSLTRKGSIGSFADRTYATNIPDDYIDPFGSDSDSDFDDPFKPHPLLNKRVRITDTSVVHSNMTNLVQWPDPSFKSKANRGTWKHWNPEFGMEGKVVHVWKPFHRDSKQRSYLDKNIFLLIVEDRYYVPVNESGTEQV